MYMPVRENGRRKMYMPVRGDIWLTLIFQVGIIIVIPTYF